MPDNSERALGPPRETVTARIGESEKGVGDSPTVSANWAGDASREIKIPSVIGSVAIQEQIGQGGMGVVFRGWDQVLHRDVAVKFLLNAGVDQLDRHFQQFLHGARAEAAVRHPNIVIVHSGGVVEAIPYMVMDYIDGPTLRELMEKTGRLSLATAVKIIIDIASAVGALHEHDLIHRDIKPGNIIFDRGGRLFVTDFGLAFPRRRSDTPESVAGTPAYMAPETFAGQASPQSDVYALGIMLLELLTGRLPFLGDFASVRHQHAHTPLPLDALDDSVPPSLVEVIERAAHKKMMLRYKSAEHFQRALRRSIPVDDLVAQGAVEIEESLLNLHEEVASEAPKDQAAPSPTSTYFERLTELAAGKRTDPVSPVSADTNETLRAERLDGRTHRPEEPLCIHCGYNLRGLEPEGRCPECGTAIERSMRGDLLSSADPAWLDRLCRGQKYIVIGALLVMPGSIVITIPLQILIYRFLLGSAPRFVVDLVWEVTNGLLMCTSYAFFLVGIVGVTTLDPRLSLTDQPAGWRRFARGVGGAALIATPVSLLARFRVSATVTGLPGAVYVGSLLLLAMLLISAVAATFHLAYLGERIPDAALVQRTRTTARRFLEWLLALVGLIVIGRLLRLVPNPQVTDVVLDLLKIGALICGLGFFALGLRLILVWWDYRKALTRCLVEARRQPLGDEGEPATVRTIRRQHRGTLLLVGVVVGFFLFVGTARLVTTARHADSIEVATLASQLKSENLSARTSGARRLGEIGPGAKEAVPALVDALSDSDVDLRKAAAVALGRIGPDAADAVPALAKSLKDKHPSVRQAAAPGQSHLNLDRGSWARIPGESESH